MSTLPDDLKPEDPLVLVSADRNKRAEPVTVTRVGRTYVYAAYDGHSEMPVQFHRDSGIAKENTGWKRQLVTPAQHEDTQERESLLAELREAGIEVQPNRQDQVSTAQLRGLHAVMNPEV